jgi:hypothetical protein
MLTWRTVGMHVPSSFFQVLFASKAWKRAEEQQLQSWSRYIHVYTCICLYIVVCPFLTIAYQMICCANWFFHFEKLIHF